ncbi:GNAT family protein [Amaricoccus sp.]|uniref:GNAT family N-acetyltransferase n=1 Tax=Amaricoccus sp. TaxID=1872485 RepID=UPI0025C37EAA|nr:GNAT family protein [Amaricoccus sp.]
MLTFRRHVSLAIETPRLVLRLPEMADHVPWATLRRDGEAFLRPWEPTWSADHLTRKAFRTRVYWAQRARDEGRALALFLVRRPDARLLGAITLDNIRRGPSQSAQVGYWIGAPFARQGYMTEALDAVVRHAFEALDLGRIEAACLPENVASRGLLERSGFVHEGVAVGYLQIAGRWRDHVLYANLRADRRSGTTNLQASEPWPS